MLLTIDTFSLIGYTLIVGSLLLLFLRYIIFIIKGKKLRGRILITVPLGAFLAIRYKNGVFTYSTEVFKPEKGVLTSLEVFIYQNEVVKIKVVRSSVGQVLVSEFYYYKVLTYGILDNALAVKEQFGVDI